ncbi:MAG: ATP-dependent DNA helicase RecG [Treponemataceae bacterium]
MILKEIENPIESLIGVGPSTSKCFSRLNIFKVSELLCTYPKNYEDRTVRTSLKDFSNSKIHTIAQVIEHQWFGYGKMKTLKIIITDGTAQACLVCFNRPFMEKTLPIGSIISLTAKFIYSYGQIQSSSFDAQVIAKNGNLKEIQKNPDPFARILPIYNLTKGITQKQYEKAVNQALKMYGIGISNELPQDVIQNQNLLEKRDAIFKIHQGKNLDEIQQAIKTIKFEELYFFQKTLLENALERRGSIKCESDFADLSPRQTILLNNLTFKLSEDQKNIIGRINAEIDASIKSRTSNKATVSQKPFTMAQLIQGDVGSGKTLIAFFSAARIIDWGGQCCLLAPTELLANQHAENAAKLLGKCNISVSFLTGNINSKGRNNLLASIKQGQTQLIVGTHSLFSANVQYANLQLAIIDEQHRFGVVQRNFIKEKCSIPNILMMSATPIPQSLAQTVFADLDISTIKTMPKGRIPIKTHLTKPGNENFVYETVRSELKAGHQAYFVYPMIEENETENSEYENFENNFLDSGKQNLAKNSQKKIKNASEMFDFLSKQVYPEFKCAIIHSKIEREEQCFILEQFKQNKIQIIVATTVVEVGVDVPNATCIVIEQAERFGLAALHQLRGRVGRSSLQSHCFLIYGKKLTEIAKERLKAMFQTTDGFKIAELDLKLRGPGEVNGIQQSGFLSLGLSNPINDKELLELARQEAKKHLSIQD